jgi:hypothetical protein
MEDHILDEYKKEALRIEEDSIHSAKGHYNAAHRWSHINLWIGIPNTVLAAIAGVSAFEGCTIFAGSIAITVAAVAALNTFLNPGDRSANHRRCAGEYLALRNSSRIFVNIKIFSYESDQELIAQFEELSTKRNDLNSTSPQIPEWAFKKAKSGIDSGQATYKV